MEAFAEINKMTGMHGFIIGYIYRRGGEVFQKDIETEFVIRRSTATGILNLMEKNGLIVRVPVERDKRLKSLVLTDKAIKVHEKVMDEISAIEDLLVRGLSAEEIADFECTLRKIKNNLMTE